MYGQFNPFINSSGGGGGGTSEKVRYSITEFINDITGETTYKLGQSINDGSVVYVGDIISYSGDQILVEYDGQPVILNTALAGIESFIDKTYNFTTFTELEIDTRGKTLQQITDELIALDLPQNTVVTGQLYTDALPFSGNGEAEVIVNKPAYWWKCTSLTNAPYSWNAIVGSGGWSGIKMNWTPTYYSLPVATAQTLGGVKIGNNINVDQNGVISIDDPVEYLAGDGISFSESAEGIEINNDGVISIATGVSDNTIDITTKDSTNSVSINLSKATDAILGGVKVGAGLNVENDGTLNVDGYTAGEGISFSQGQNLDTVISNDGVLSVVGGQHNTIDVTTIEGTTQISLGTTYSEGVGIEIVNASSGLPSGYIRLEYVTCNFRQYINTLYYANQDTVVEIEAATQNKYSDMPLFGTRKSGSEQQFVCWFGGMYSTNEETGCLFVLGDYTWQSYNPILLGDSVGQPIKIVCTPSSLSVNDVVLWEGTEVYNIDTTNSIYLGACNQNGSPFQTYFDGDIYDCIIKENDTVIKHFIPCTSPTNVVGFYETQSETFIRSITGTDFIAGPPSPGQEGMIINNDGVLDINLNSSDNTILDVDFQDGIKQVQLPKYSAGTGISFVPPQSAGESTAINNSGVLDITAGSSSNTVIVTKASGDTTITIPAATQTQSNWTQADDTKVDYIKNKPNLGAAALKNVDQAPTTESQNLVESGGVYSALSNKVDKVNGKGLSTNDFTDALKNKLDEIDTGAEVNQNAYSNIKIDNTTITAGTKTDTLELIAGANVLLTPNVNDKSIEINSKDTTYSVAIASTSGVGGSDGLMAATDKEKLNGVAAGAEVNQNAFSGVKVGNDTIEADSKTDVIELIAGTNITLTSDTTNDTVTIATNLGTAATKDYTTSVTSGSNDLVTSGAVYTAIDNLPEPMVFKGSLGTGGTITELPVDGSATVGDTYKVITDGTYASKTAKIGDTFICLTKTSDANTWELIPSGDEPSGTVTNVKIQATSPIAIDDSSAITTSGMRTISHAASGATAGSYGDSSNQTPSYGGIFKVPYVTVNETGHVTSISEHTVQIPASDNTNTTYTLSGETTSNTQQSIKLTPSDGSAAQTIAVVGKRTGTSSIGEIFNCYSGNQVNKAIGSYSHAEGCDTAAEAAYAHAEGYGTIASGSHSHAEGYQTTAGSFAHSEGYGSSAFGEQSHAQNYGTKASSDSQTALGKYNVEDANDTYAVIIGNGASDNARSNALAVDWNGNVFCDDHTTSINEELAEAIDNGSKNLSPISSGSTIINLRYVEIPIVLQAGTYVIYFDSLTSTDTDATTCNIGFFANGTRVSTPATSTIARGNKVSITLSVTATTDVLRVYASDTSAHSESDTITFSGLMVCTETAWNASPVYEPYAISNASLTSTLIKTINNGAKNALKITNYNPGESYSYRGRTFTVQEDGGIKITGNDTGSSGNVDCYIVGSWNETSIQITASTEGYVLALKTDDTISGNVQICAYNRSTGSTVNQLRVGAGTYLGNEVNFDITCVFISISYSINVGDGIVVYPVLCKKEFWNIDRTFTEYALPNVPITSGLIELVDTGAKNLIVPVTPGAVEGIVFTRNADGSVTVACTNITSNKILQIGSINAPNVSQQYVFSGCTGGSSSTYQLGIYDGTTAIIYQNDDAVNYTGNISTYIVRLRIIATAQNPFSGTITVKPMICTKAAWDVSQKYVPYCPNMAELYKETCEEETVTLTNTLSTSICDVQNSSLVVYRKGKTCIARLSVKIDGTLTGNDEINTTAMPTAIRPKFDGYFAFVSRDAGGWASANMASVVCTFGTNGKITIRSGTNAASAVYIVGTATWFIS